MEESRCARWPVRRVICSFLACLVTLWTLPTSASGLELRAVAPDSVGLTLQKSPVLYYFISEATTLPILFTLRKSRATRGVVEVSLPSPDRAGFWPVRLKDYGIILEAGVEYRWFVTVIQKQEEVVAGGVVECCPDDLLYDSPKDCKSTDTVLHHTSYGIWYDAIACLGEVIEAEPNNEKLRRLWERLLRDRGGLILTDLR
jgi:hypothetical protein